MTFDRTSFFKARAKLLTTKGAAAATDPDKPVNSGRHPVTSISYRRHSCDLQQLASDLYEFYDALRGKQIPYVLLNSPMYDMTDAERDKLDYDSDKEFNHLLHVYWILKERYQHMANVFMIMRKHRIRAMAERKQYESLHALTKYVMAQGVDVAGEWERSLGTGSTNKGFRSRQGSCDGDDWVNTERISTRVGVAPVLKVLDDAKHPVASDACPAEDHDEVTDDGFTDEEKAQLMAENEEMFAQFGQINSEIDQLETQIAEIQRLQDRFSDKLTEQEHDIETVHDTAVRTTENLKEANEWIRDSISDSAARRMIVLFCIVVITFSLLFIDWYNA
ncbi:unnamed protein product, partial [Mesorhabditis spiculigera]